LVYGLLGRAAEALGAASDLSASEIDSLLARANAIRAISDTRARAQALGTIMG
jgi:hypothetical protein